MPPTTLADASRRSERYLVVQGVSGEGAARIGAPSRTGSCRLMENEEGRPAGRPSPH
ncbi:hypothetical protein ABZW44_42570 [Streptomyces mirabilis]|uniref:hypothetical protein n=1 Tax=Streptomyces mirabilis TaxID=68239 RepID=UPI0033B4083D